MFRAPRLVLIACALCGGWWATGRVEAAPPWKSIDLFRRLEADPAKTYPLTEAQGPWVIMAVTFSGPSAEEQARELVYVLRSQYKLPAYMHRMSFDFRDPVDGRGIDRFGQPKRMKHQRDKVVDEIAVLVGDFQAVDDPEAQKVLEKIKYARPECLDPEYIARKGDKVSRPLAMFRTTVQSMMPDWHEQKQYGPMGHAFITSNPLLPDDYFRPGGLDKFVVDLNKNLEHSLLDCPGKYTVRVATFRGAVLVDQKQIRAAEAGAKAIPSRLEEAAQKAHQLCEALRKQGVEAYEFHDRTSSWVTVGSFDSIGATRPDGKIDLYPQVLKIIEQYGTAPAVGSSTPYTTPKALGGIAFDVQPLPVEVPRPSIAADYNRSISLR